jgi:hypothetical protein
MTATTCYNRFVRWRQAGICEHIMEALATGHDAAVQMIDTTVVRVHQHGACFARVTDRTVLQQDQTMSACRDPIRQTRGQLSGIRQTRIDPNLATR